MSIEYREATAGDLFALKIELNRIAEKLQRCSPKVSHRNIDVGLGCANVLDADSMYIVDGYFLAVSEEYMWWDDRPVLAEKLLCNLYHSDFGMASVTQFMEEEAKRRGCAFVSSGSALAKSDAALERVYSASGWSPVARMFMKEV